MRLGIKVLNVGASLNSFKQVPFVRIARGETLDLAFQLVDLDQDGLRYIPSAGATVQFQVPRMIDVVVAPNNSRAYVNNTIDRPASQAFSQDPSIWTVSLISQDTSTLISNSIRVVLTEGANTKIATLTQAIKVIDGHEN